MSLIKYEEIVVFEANYLLVNKLNVLLNGELSPEEMHEINEKCEIVKQFVEYVEELTDVKIESYLTFVDALKVAQAKLNLNECGILCKCANDYEKLIKKLDKYYNYKVPRLKDTLNEDVKKFLLCEY